MFSVEKEDICAKSYLVFPYIFEQAPCFIYPLQIRDIVAMGHYKYKFYLNLLVMDKSDIKTIFKSKGIEADDEFLETFTCFDYLLSSAKTNESFLLETQKAFFTFIREEVTFLFDLEQIVIGDITEKRFINKENFPLFQDILRVQNRIDIKEEIPPDESEFAKNMRLKREQVEEIKKKNKEKESPDEDSATFSDLISSLCAYGVGITPFNIGDLSIYSFQEALERLQEKDKFALDIQSLLAGADSKKINPKFWIRKLKKKD